ncbi:MAG: O-antigen ligase family protein, partial [Candidatus Roizmanbacteria bacterium]|nr:O-antigen ligase family protein [Candidatus Roizmanbacteria bacterium]
MTGIIMAGIRYSYYALFFLIPLLLTPWNYELFEFNKMLFVYAVSIIVGSLWLVRMTLEKRVIFRQTPLDIPIALFLVAHLVSTIQSIDPHISVWGYYGRFNGGLVSLMSYVLLYYAMVSNLSDQKNNRTILTILRASLVSGILVSFYGIAQHFGIDAHIWVQDVQNRVFSTLGQPNWLAAYVAVLTPLSISLILYGRIARSRFGFVSYVWGVSSVIYYLTLLYTKSRSGFLAMWLVLGIFWLGTFAYLQWKSTKLKEIQKVTSDIFMVAGITTAAFLVITTITGTPFEKVNTLLSVWKPTPQEQVPPEVEQQVATDETALSSGGLNITDSGDIRKLVWQGAFEAARARPYFGWGVETFAWIFYQFKPVEHNLTSEWDFLYNKAHNEYLNYAATTGFIGLASYLSIIGVFMVWFIRNMRYEIRETGYNARILAMGLFAGWLSLLVTNFFGFSVVATSVYFWLIPSLIVILLSTHNHVPAPELPKRSVGMSQWIP